VFGLASLRDLPDLDRLEEAGLLGTAPLVAGAFQYRTRQNYAQVIRAALRPARRDAPAARRGCRRSGDRDDSRLFLGLWLADACNRAAASSGSGSGHLSRDASTASLRVDGRRPHPGDCRLDCYLLCRLWAGGGCAIAWWRSASHRYRARRPVAISWALRSHRLKIPHHRQTSRRFWADRSRDVIAVPEQLRDVLGMRKVGSGTATIAARGLVAVGGETGKAEPVGSPRGQNLHSSHMVQGFPACFRYLEFR
jgi:hypothetical protein